MVFIEWALYIFFTVLPEISELLSINKFSVALTKSKN